MEKSQTQTDNQTLYSRSGWIFWVSCIAYAALLLLFFLLFFTDSVGLRTGLIIGSIYVYVTLYYFYEKFLLPYIQEKRSITIDHPNIYVWVLQWIVPTIGLQVFVCLGFWVTLDRIPVKNCIFTHPYHYGQIYKRLDAFEKKKTEIF